MSKHRVGYFSDSLSRQVLNRDDALLQQGAHDGKDYGREQKSSYPREDEGEDQDERGLFSQRPRGRTTTSTTPARSSVATVYSRCERELAFLGTHGYTFRVRPPSQIRGYLTPTRPLAAWETAASRRYEPVQPV
jgi:hypothetical protein